MHPQEAVDEYIESRKVDDAADSTVTNYTYRLKRFVEFAEKAGIGEMEQVTGRTTEQYKKDRVNNGGVNPVTLQQQLRTFRHFLTWCEVNDYVEEGIADKMIIPNCTPEQQVRNNAIDCERAERIVEWLREYKYASRRHIVFEILWHTGMRIGSLRALDVDDFQQKVEKTPHDPDADQRVTYVLEIRHRPEGNTPLKLKMKGERNVTITDGELSQAIEDYIERERPNVEDTFGREPLIATTNGRASKTTLRTDVYHVVQPCRYENFCPHGRDVDDCEFQAHRKKGGCPSSQYPHAIRSGTITRHLNEDVPKEIVSERVNVSEDTLDQHYDERTKTDKRKRREKYL